MNTFQEIPASKKSISKRKPIYGVGINDATYTTKPLVNGIRKICPYFRVWQSMLTRCYDPKCHEKQPTYLECYVCDSWLVFSTFKEWMQKQDWKEKQLDKDLLIRGNKLYSPETCIFVSSQVNSLLSNAERSRGALAIGVCWSKKAKAYMASCKTYGKNNFLGYFNTELEASNVYNSFKNHHILNIAYEQEDVKIKQALIHIVNTEY